MATKYYATGIDVSSWQGTIDWTKVAADGIEFAIIRVGDGSIDDSKAVYNAEGARANGLQIGLYIFSRAITEQEARTEAAKCIAFANAYCPDMELPIFFDFETTYDTTTQEDGRAWAIAFCTEVENAGYKAGIYYNYSFNRRFYGENWWAEHPTYTRWLAYPSADADVGNAHDYWQYTWTGRVDGINGDVDMNRRLFVYEPETEPQPEAKPAVNLPTSQGIEYVEIRGSDTEVIGIVDTAQSIIWHSKYFGVGDFEIYVHATPEMIALLEAGNYVTRPDDLEVGIIENISITDDPQGGMMIAASGRFAKSLLDRRVIYNLAGTVNKPTTLKGYVEDAVFRLVSDNAINCPFDVRRNIPILKLGDFIGSKHPIVGESGNASKQVSHENLLTYTDALLQEYGLGATVILDEKLHVLRYVIYNGADRRITNTAGNDPIVFSKDFDNLTGSNYEYSSTASKNVALIGGEGEGLERYYTMLMPAISGIARREMFVDASSLARTYKDENDVEQTYTDEEYTSLLIGTGRQTLSQNANFEQFIANLDIQNSVWRYNRDFALGDIVTVQNTDMGKYIDMRLCEVIEAQDENGYAIEANIQT